MKRLLILLLLCLPCIATDREKKKSLEEIMAERQVFIDDTWKMIDNLRNLLEKENETK